MKNTRKKMLLSSVAMLLVALVALGSATYAWFTINKEVTADTMVVNAATTAGLQITNKNGNEWARDVHFTDSDITLAPTSRGFTASALQSAGYLPQDVSTTGSGARAWVVADGNSNPATNWKADAGRPTVPSGDVVAQASNAYYAEYRVGVKSSGSDIEDVVMNLNYTDGSASGKSAEGFIRIVVMEEDVTAPVAYIADGGASTNAVTAINTTTKIPSSVAAQVNTSATDVAVGTMTSTARYFRIIVWFEGQDADCTDTNQAAKGTIDVKFSFD